MIKLYPEQLHSFLRKKLYVLYLLVGNDSFLLKESLDIIRQIIFLKNFNQYHSFQVDNQTDWNLIFSLCQRVSLFATRQILHLFFSEKISYNSYFNKNIEVLMNFIHKDLLLIIQWNNLKIFKENISLFREIFLNSILVICQTPKKENLLKWIMLISKKKQLDLNQDVCNLLCHYYEGNLLSLNQFLEKISLILPKNKLTFFHIRKIIDDDAKFTPFHLVDTLLLGNIKHALHILQHLRFQSNNPLIILRILQREILSLLKLKRQSKNIKISELLNKHRIWNNNRRSIISSSLNRLEERQLSQALILISHIESSFQYENQCSLIWIKLENLSFLFCGQPLSVIFSK